MGAKNRRQPRQPAALVAVDPEQAVMVQYAREGLEALRKGFMDGDPFDSTTFHDHVRRMFRRRAAIDERNCAWVLQVAMAGNKDAHDALSDLVSVIAPKAPLGSALTTFVNMNNNNGPPHFWEPAVRPMRNHWANMSIICLVAALMATYPGRLHLQRSEATVRLSAFAIVALVLREAGILRGASIRRDEDAVRKVWHKYGPPAASRPDQWGPVWPPQKI
jgi:hypothetical protein